MMVVRKTDDGLTKGMRWSARAVGLIACGLLALFLIESGARVLHTLSWSSLRGVPLFVALVVAGAGLLIAWRWELIGSAMTVIGGLAIIGLAYLESGHSIVLAAFCLALPLLVAGVLYLSCGYRQKAI